MLPLFGRLAAMAAALLISFAPAWGDSIDTIATWHVPSPRPLGQVFFCRAHPTWCAGVEQTAPIPVTPELAALLARVNVSVNHVITYRPEARAMIESWEIDPKYGDCEDYAVTKLARLMAAGLPRPALRIAFYRLPNGVYHAVLTVETTGGTVVLSNLSDRVMPWRAVPDADWLGIERVSRFGYMAFWGLSAGT